jgi:heme/copper-type cytochrome/quinol oxidase subunit 2
MLAICLVIFLAVFGVMFYSIWKHRKSVGHKSANFHESTAVEIAWTVVPFPSSLVWLFLPPKPWLRKRHFKRGPDHQGHRHAEAGDMTTSRVKAKVLLCCSHSTQPLRDVPIWAARRLVNPLITTVKG